MTETPDPDRRLLVPGRDRGRTGRFTPRRTQRTLEDGERLEMTGIPEVLCVALRATGPLLNSR